MRCTPCCADIELFSVGTLETCKRTCPTFGCFLLDRHLNSVAFWGVELTAQHDHRSSMYRKYREALDSAKVSNKFPADASVSCFVKLNFHRHRELH